MNRIRKAERDRIQRRADQIVQIDANTQGIANSSQAQEILMREFSISRDRAFRHVAKVAIRRRSFRRPQ